MFSHLGNNYAVYLNSFETIDQEEFLGKNPHNVRAIIDQFQEDAPVYVSIGKNLEQVRVFYLNSLRFQQYEQSSDVYVDVNGAYNRFLSQIQNLQDSKEDFFIGVSRERLEYLISIKDELIKQIDHEFPSKNINLDLVLQPPSVMFKQLTLDYKIKEEITSLFEFRYQIEDCTHISIPINEAFLKKYGVEIFETEDKKNLLVGNSVNL